jgi:hypothetical protein
MKRVVLAAALVLSLFVSAAITPSEALACDAYVNGYYRADGTYVQGHYRTCPNSSTYDNYSTSGNYNPYTGQPGTRSPYSPSRCTSYWNC